MNVVDPKAWGGRFIGESSQIAEIFASADPYYGVLANLQDSLRILGEDYLKANDAARIDGGDMFWRRTLIKGLFSLIEAQLYGLKRIALALSEHFCCEFAEKELAKLQEKNENSGKPYYQSFVKDWEFSIKAYAKAHGNSFKIDPALEKRVKELKKVRDRLTHPKAASELRVSAPEVQTCREAFKGFCRLSSDLAKLHNNLKPKGITIYNGAPFTFDLPFVAFFRDGTVFEFEEENNAQAFCKERVEGASTRSTFFVARAEDLHV